jgi:hypothetical protein
MKAVTQSREDLRARAFTFHPRSAMLFCFHGVMRLLVMDDQYQAVKPTDMQERRLFFRPYNWEDFGRRIAQLLDSGELVKLPFDPVKCGHGPTARESYRGRINGAGSLGSQFVFHYEDGAPERVEFDLDESPVDLVGFVKHLRQADEGLDPRECLARLWEAGIDA